MSSTLLLRTSRHGRQRQLDGRPEERLSSLVLPDAVLRLVLSSSIFTRQVPPGLVQVKSVHNALMDGVLAVSLKQRQASAPGLGQ